MLLTVVLRESRFHNALTTRKLALFFDVTLENTLTEKEIKWMILTSILWMETQEKDRYAAHRADLRMDAGSNNCSDCSDSPCHSPFKKGIMLSTV